MHHLDGEVTANRALELEAHTIECGACRDESAALGQLVRGLRAPVTVTGPATVARVMGRLDELDPVRHHSSQGARRWRWLVGGMGLAAAATATVVAIVAARSPSESELDGELQARGGAASTPGQQVGLTFYALLPEQRAAWSDFASGAASSSAELPRLIDGALVTPTTAYVASYRNLSSVPTHAMVFAIDAVRELHWLYPAYVDAEADPRSVALPIAPRDTLFAETVVLDAPARGRMTLIAVVTAAPLRVTDIERLPSRARTLEGLRARWPDADLTTVIVEVR